MPNQNTTKELVKLVRTYRELVKKQQDELVCVKAELDFAAKQVGVEFAECVALRARVAELERDLQSCRDLIKCDSKQITEYTIRTVHAEQRNAELVAALLDAANALESDNESERHVTWNRIRDLNLARAESATPVLPMRDDPHYKGTDYKSATPAKHPDTERLDWLEHQTANESRTGISFDYCRHVEEGLVVERGFRFMKHHFLGDMASSIRAAIDAARKQEVKRE